MTKSELVIKKILTTFVPKTFGGPSIDSLEQAQTLVFTAASIAEARVCAEAEGDQEVNEAERWLNNPHP